MTRVMTCETAVPSTRARAIKARQQAMWASGDFAVIGATLQIVGELLAEAADARACHRVLDVAAGSGNATLAAARRFATVTSTDYVPALLERGRRRAAAEGFANVAFDVADAEALPYPDASFDIVLSTFGAMFAPDHQRTAAELTRVCRPGGRIGLANRTPSGFLGELLRLVAKHVPPPRRSVSRPLGYGRVHPRAVPGRQPDRAGDAIVRIPLPVCAPLGADVPGLLRTDAHRLPGARGRRPSGPRGGPHGAPAFARRRRTRRTRLTCGVPGDSDHPVNWSAG